MFARVSTSEQCQTCIYSMQISGGIVTDRVIRASKHEHPKEMLSLLISFFFFFLTDLTSSLFTIILSFLMSPSLWLN